MTFMTFDVMDGVVKVYDGEDSMSLLLGAFTQQTLPSNILSTERHLYLSFESPTSDDEFLVSYIAIAPGT